ncbi:LamG domain-containing protein, partial [Verrucomicrobiales bacterium]|nr:LamG domain-containing protein [Verrucomicrobiales bacterium]
MILWRIWFTATCLVLIGLVTRLDAGVLSLNGNSYVELANPSGVFPIGNESFTIEAWINPTSIPAGGTAGGQITFWGNQSGNQANGFRMRGNQGLRHYFWGNDQDANTSEDMLGDTTGLNGDGWHHLALSYNADTTNSTFFHNGISIGTQHRHAGVNVADANYRIGSRLDNREFFHGYIDELR